MALALAGVQGALGQPATSEAPPQGKPPVVVATVDARAVYEAEVDRLLRRRWNAEPGPTPSMRDRAIEALIEQRLALIRLERLAEGKVDGAVDQAMQKWIERVNRRGQTEAEALAASAMTRAAVRQQIAWQVHWRLYLDRHLTEARLRDFFAKHRRDFDGTELRVRQVQWNLGEAADPSKSASPTVSQLIERAAEVREQISQQLITFEAASRQFSQSPSAETGGDLGWITRNGPMHDQFSAAAFTLQPGEISEPVQSPFGVHLILCEEVRPGEQKFEEVRDEVEVAARSFLFRRLVEQQRPLSTIRRGSDEKDD